MKLSIPLGTGLVRLNELGGSKEKSKGEKAKRAASSQPGPFLISETPYEGYHEGEEETKGRDREHEG